MKLAKVMSAHAVEHIATLEAQMPLGAEGILTQLIERALDKAFNNGHSEGYAKALDDNDIEPENNEDEDEGEDE